MLKIERSVKIEIDQEGLKQLVVDKIAQEDPSIVVDNIEFTQRRNPTCIEVSVDAHMESGEKVKIVETPLEEEPMKADLDLEDAPNPAEDLINSDSLEEEEEIDLDESEEDSKEEDPFA